MSPGGRGFGWCAAGVIFLSAFLLFQVQPLISKAILPWFGGSPAVWTTAMLFFQVVLLAGYAYAHLVTRLVRGRAVVLLHGALLVVAALTLPITPGEAFKPAADDRPVLGILLLLAGCVGLPYFLLASTGPLVQAWFARVYPGVSPYRLYSLSNLGSLLALLSYPFVVEPSLTVGQQGWTWSAAFLLFAVACGLLSYWAARYTGPPAEVPSAADDTPAGGETRAPGENSAQDPTVWPRGRMTYVWWFVLPALAVVILLAVTNRLCRDIAVVPFLWIAPLSLYLLSFIICFDHQRWYSPGGYGILTAVVTVFVCLFDSSLLSEFLEPWGISWQPFASLRDNVWSESAIYLTWMALACMVCHGELYRLKPPSRQLTAYYLCISAGGALGGVLVALVCPLIFTTYYEWNLALVVVYGLAVCVGGYHAWEHWLARLPVLRVSLVLCMLGGMLLCARSQFGKVENDVVKRVRNFYGVVTVRQRLELEWPQYNGMALYHGRILHGFQFEHPKKRREGAMYYGPASGSGITMDRLHALRGPLRVGVMGLGAGTMAALGREGDKISFYEIDPDVIKLQDKYFSYIRDSEAEVRILHGDARLTMERQKPQRFDVLFMDAFSGDAIPAHLVTREAIDLYQRHLKENGLIVLHISNRYLDLIPIARGLSEHTGMEIVRLRNVIDEGLQQSTSDWVVLTSDPDFLNDEVILAKGQKLHESIPAILWTDQFSNLFEVLK